VKTLVGVGHSSYDFECKFRPSDVRRWNASNTEYAADGA